MSRASPPPFDGCLDHHQVIHRAEETTGLPPLLTAVANISNAVRVARRQPNTFRLLTVTCSEVRMGMVQVLESPDDHAFQRNVGAADRDQISRVRRAKTAINNAPAA